MKMSKIAMYNFVIFILFEAVISATDEEQELWEELHQYAFQNYWDYIYWPQVNAYLHCSLFLQKFNIASELTAENQSSGHFFCNENDLMIIKYRKKKTKQFQKVGHLECFYRGSRYNFIKISPPGCVGRVKITKNLRDSPDGHDHGEIADVKCDDEFEEFYEELDWDDAFQTPNGVITSVNEDQQKTWTDQHRMAFESTPWKYILWPEINPRHHCPLFMFKFGIIPAVTDDNLVEEYYEERHCLIIRNGNGYTEVGHLICGLRPHMDKYHFIKTSPPGCVARAEVIDVVLRREHAKIVDVKCEDVFNALYQ